MCSVVVVVVVVVIVLFEVDSALEALTSLALMRARVELLKITNARVNLKVVAVPVIPN